MRIAFYISNMKENIDYSNPEQPNPGIGGTQLMIWTLSYYLKKIYDDLDIHLFAPNINKLPKNLKLVEAKDEIECINLCKTSDIDILVLRGPILDKRIYEYIDKMEVKTIMWSHNFETYKAAKWASECENIVRNVCVSFEQYDWLRDSELRHKSEVIYNALDFSNYETIDEKTEEKSICYIGNLYPYSGFDTLADIWPIISEKVPETKLYIIGGNNLYKSGPNLRAKEAKSYERKINKVFYNNNELSENVHFLGVLGGTDKLRVMSKCRVGIANITPAGETFGIAAVEFQALQVPVVSFNKYGLRETVKQNNTGVLVGSKNEMAQAIIDLLLNDEMYEKLKKNGRAFIAEQFSIEEACEKWYELFQRIENNYPVEGYKRDEYFNYDNKQLLLLNSKLKSFRILKHIPSILMYKYIKYVSKRLYNILKP